jgi:hypothetical protein
MNFHWLSTELKIKIDESANQRPNVTIAVGWVGAFQGEATRMEVV